MIPTPQYYVFYNGNEKRPEREILKLSDAFKVPVGEGCFEWTATVLNINYGCNKELMEKCDVVYEYAFKFGANIDKIDKEQFDKNWNDMNELLVLLKKYEEELLKVNYI